MPINEERGFNLKIPTRQMHFEQLHAQNGTARKRKMSNMLERKRDDQIFSPELFGPRNPKEKNQTPSFKPNR